MSKAQPLSGKNREQRNSRREQHSIPSQEYIRLDESEFYAFVESASDRAVKYAVRDYVDSKDFVTNERLAASERYIVAELRNEISNLGTALRQELRQDMRQQSNTMLGGFSALAAFLAALITFLAWVGGAFSKAEPQQSTQYVPAPYSLEQPLAPKAPAANP